LKEFNCGTYGKSVGIDVQNRCHMPVGMLLVQAKAHSVCKDLSKHDDNVKPFSASAGRFSRFAKRCNFLKTKVTGEAASADAVAVIHFVR
jgi:hypothetical protein